MCLLFHRILASSTFIRPHSNSLTSICISPLLRSGEARFPAQIHDVKAAVRLLRSRADIYNLDTNRFIAWGASAGAHLASLLGASAHNTSDPVVDMPSLNSFGNESPRVQAVVDWYGPQVFANMDVQLEANPACSGGFDRHNTSISPEARLIGAALWEAPDQWALTSPIRYVTHACPPFIIEHGTADCVVPHQQSVDLHAELVKVIGADKVKLRLVEGEQHATPVLEENANMALVFDWLDDMLGM